jgi:hypothetical protein
MGQIGMVIRCVSFGSLWWLRPGDQLSDPLRYSARAATFNTTGFVSGARERRHWHVSGIVRINMAMHGRVVDCPDAFEGECYETPGLERRGVWNRVLLTRRLKHTTRAEKILICVESREIGHINFDGCWRAPTVSVIAASAFGGCQETLLLAMSGAEFRTETGQWEISWKGIVRKP